MKKKNRSIQIIVFALLLLVPLWLAINFFGEKYLEKKIKNFETSSFTFSSQPEINVRILQRKISMNQLNLTGETEKINVEELQLSGIHIFPFIFKGEIIINKAIIDKPDIVISEKTEKNTSKRIKKKIRVKKLELKNGQFLLNETDSAKNDTIVYFAANIGFRNLNINSNTERIIFQNHSFERIHILANNCKYFLPNGLYHSAFDTLTFNSRNPELTIVNARLKSNYPKYKIAHTRGVETDWFDINLDSFKLKNIQLQELLNNSLLIAKKAELNGLEVHSFRDKRLPFPEKPDTKLPMQMIKSLPVKIHTDSIVLKNSYIDYTEHRQNSDNAGIIKFHAVNASIANLSNIDSLITGETRMKASSRLMNETMLNAEFIFPNSVYEKSYQVSGTIKPVKITTFNPMAVPVASVRVESGQTKNLAFNFYYDNESSNGDMIFEYENLKITLLNKENNSSQNVKSFFANALLLKKNNLQSKNSFNKGTISFERDKKKSIFNYWWKSVLSGIKTSATN